MINQLYALLTSRCDWTYDFETIENARFTQINSGNLEDLPIAMNRPAGNYEVPRPDT